jgi:hypothetical protein
MEERYSETRRKRGGKKEVGKKHVRGALAWKRLKSIDGKEGRRGGEGGRERER